MSQLYAFGRHSNLRQRQLFKKNCCYVCFFIFVVRFLLYAIATPKRPTGLPHEVSQWPSVMAGRRRIFFVNAVSITVVFGNSKRQQDCILDIL
jgi:hypothetical protein